MNATPQARILLVTGFALALLGVILPALMVLGAAKSTLFLNFFSYTASVAGIFLGLIGAAIFARK